MEYNVPRIVVAGTHSGVGKTTIVTGLLAALAARGLTVQSYKIGPDYIDPGYHQLASGKPAHNLDTWLVPAGDIVSIFAKTARYNDIAVIEGVMGLYDGGDDGISSTAEVAKLLQAPVVLVIDARSMGQSAAAVALGYRLYDEDVNFAGVIVNRLGSDSHQDMVCAALDKAGIAVLGCLRRDEGLHLPERHLGLTPVTEYDGQNVVAEMASHVSESVAIEKIIGLARSAPSLRVDLPEENAIKRRVRIGIAKDEVFSFYYPESLDVLADYGAELVYFSPLYDAALPDGIDGMILGGGFPEMFLEQLSANSQMHDSIRRAAEKGMPIYAECGGLMYLTRQVVDFSGKAYDMSGIIPAVCVMESKLQAVGYVEGKALDDNVLVPAGQVVRGHEFHFSRMVTEKTPFPWAFAFRKKRGGASYSGGFAQGNILASYLHMHFAGDKGAAERFIAKCEEYKTDRK